MRTSIYLRFVAEYDPLEKRFLFELTPGGLRDLIERLGEKPFRAGQIWQWAYKRLACGFDEMSDLPAELRETLAGLIPFSSLSPLDELKSSDGFTRKWLFELHDGRRIETVLMKYDSRSTACISTQAGCAMGCSFCATGQMGFERNLTAGEIVEQTLFVARTLLREGKRLSNLVLMGMGEPLHNYDEVINAVRRLIDPDSLAMGARRITLSTVGLANAIRRLARENLKVGLSVSLHGTSDKERSVLIPAARGWKIDDLISACREYFQSTGRRVSFEWALIKGVNDRIEDAARLAALLVNLPCHVNIIPLNPTDGYDGVPPSRERVDLYCDALSSRGINATVRMRRGTDIAAGCGQLKARRATRTAETGA